MPNRVFVAGSANIDLVATVRRLPGPGETVLAASLQTLPGGKGANQAVAAAKAGARVTFFGCVGNEGFGEQVVATLASAGVDLTHLHRSLMPTGTALIAVDEQGQNQISIFPGANSSLKFCDGFNEATRGDVLLCQCECPLDVILEYLQVARRQHVTTILNAAPVVKLSVGLLRTVDVLIVNEEEAARYFEILHNSAPPTADFATIAKGLRVRADQIVIVTLGEKGVAAFAGDREIRIAGHKVAVRDTTGAGDCFCGYLASCLADGKKMDQALTLANAAAALAVQKHGASAAMPESAAVQEFLGTS